MFEFRLEPHLPLLTVTRTGQWSLETVRSYEAALRLKLAKLHSSGRSTGFIIDIRSSAAHPSIVADALRAMVARLGPLHAHRTAVVTSGGLSKLQAKRLPDDRAQVFTSMVLARDWIASTADPIAAPTTVRDEPIDAAVAGPAVHIHGPPNVDITLTPAAALETAKRIGDAAIEALIGPVAVGASS